MIPYKKGQRFKTKGGIYTVKSFFSDSCKEYDTLVECIKNNNPCTILIVKNEEYNGATLIEDGKLINNK